LIIDILLLQALKARISEERQARDVEITSLRMQSKRDIAALEAKLAQSSSQYVMIQTQLFARHSCFAAWRSSKNPCSCRRWRSKTLLPRPQLLFK
jgi:hypothetical protein